MLDFVVHAPPQHSHHSAGFRALYKFTNGLKERGKSVAIRPITTRPIGLPGYVPEPSPYDIPFAEEFSDAEVHRAIHFYPDIFSENFEKVERYCFWMGRHEQFQNLPKRALKFTWIQEWNPQAPRLCIDVIEPKLFYPKKQRGEGTLFYAGKGVLEHTKEMVRYIPRHFGGPPWRPPTIIDHVWPETRADLADALRGADLLISADGNTMLNLEATICGTPVYVLPGTPRANSKLLGEVGFAYTKRSIPRAREQAMNAAERYDGVRKEIAHDIDNFLEICKRRWG